MGKVFAGRYELLDPIADGGMGSVWVVRDHQQGDIKAAKVLRQKDAASLLRFIREQATRIHHPHVLTPLGWAGADDDVLFTMPLMRGGSVATLLGDYGTLPEPWVAELLVQTLHGLGAVHEAGVVHRDIKPGNLLLDHTGTGLPRLRISDFGVAVPTDQPRLTQPFVTLGTPGYLAPEQQYGADPDPLQDIYAVGATGLQMLVGTPPPHDRVDLPETQLVALLLRAVDPDPARRPQSATAFVAQLRAVVPAQTWRPGEIEVLDQWPGPEQYDATGGTTSGATDRHGAPWWPIPLLLLAGLVLVVGGIVILN